MNEFVGVRSEILIPVLAINAEQYFFGITLFILSVFLIMLVLVQRGRGGGLTGALGGAGGQSAFGTKAGDLFTRITIVVAAIWIFLSAFAVWSMQETEFSLGTGDGFSSVSSPVMNPSGDTIPSGMTGASDLGLGGPPSDTTNAPSETSKSAAEVTEKSFEETPSSSGDGS